MKKSEIIEKVRGLIETEYYTSDQISVKNGERAVIMQTFNIGWDEINKPLSSFHYELDWDKDRLKKKFVKEIQMLELAIERNSHYVDELKYGVRGFIKGVNFFDPELAEEFYQYMNEKKLIVKQFLGKSWAGLYVINRNKELLKSRKHKELEESFNIIDELNKKHECY